MLNWNLPDENGTTSLSSENTALESGLMYFWLKGFFAVYCSPLSSSGS